jgi:DNA repair protein RAD16
VEKELIHKEHLESLSQEDLTLARAQELRSRLGLSETEIRKKKVSELKSILKNIGEPSFGTKVELTHRLLLLLFPKTSDQNNIEQDPWDVLQNADNVSKKKPKLKHNDLSDRRISLRLKTKINTEKKKKVENFIASNDTSSESYLSSEDYTDTVSSLSPSESLESEPSVHQKKRKNCLPTKKKKKIQKEVVNTDDNHGELQDEYSIDIDLSPLHVVTWERIILDEAHRIKGRTTSSAKAVYALKCSGSRWCLTGTPLQNRVGELYSLIRFLRLNPCAYYFCKTKGCECVSLHYRFKNNRFCVQCNHSRMAHYSWFNRNIITPIKKYGCQSEGRSALKILKQDVLNKILLRRTKVERADDVKLPPLTVLIRRDKLIPSEQDFYDSLYKKTATQYDTYVKQGTILHNFAHIFDLLSRLRQAVDHPYLILYGSMENASSLDEGSEKTNPVCWLCHEPFEGDVEWCQTRCHHTFHKECLDQYINSNPACETSKLGCPKCFSLLTVDSLVSLDTACTRSIQSKYSSILNRINLEEFNSSTKIEALVQELESINETDSTAKTIVFSQYAAMLDLIEFRLKKGSITCAKLVGSMSLQSR